MILRGQVYMVDLGEGDGSRQGGLRPCVIVQNDTGNLYSPTTIVCPITTKKKTKIPTHVLVTELPRWSTVLCEQVVTVDKKRLLDFVTNVDMRNIDRALKISLGV
jgi:mRNA interferase MazF